MHDISTRSPACTVCTPEPDRGHRADRLVAQDAAGLDLGHVAPEDVQVGPADGEGVHPDDGVLGIGHLGSGTSSQDLLPGP